MARFSDHGRLHWLVGGVFAVVTLAYGVHLGWGQGRDGMDVLFNDWVQNALLLGGALLCGLGAARKTEGRAPWALLAAGLGSWAAANLVWSVWIGRLSEVPYPSVSDALWLGFYPFIYCALVLLVRERVAHFHPSVWLDGLIGAAAIAALGIGVLGPSLLQAGHGQSLIVIVNLAYPLADVLLLALMAGVITLTRGAGGRALALVATGLLLNTVADIAYLIKIDGGGSDGASRLDVLWVVSQLLIAAAAWQPTRPARPARLDGLRVLVLPAAFAVVAMALLVASVLGHLAALPALLAIATLVVVLVRAGLTFRENLTLLDAREQARTDELTGLLNRRGFYADAAEQLGRRTDEEPPIAVMLLDLERFKELNDTLGHAAGDQVLCDVAGRLSATVPDALIARLGGDEFAVLIVCERGAPDALVAARRILNALETPFAVDGMVTLFSASIGIALCPDDAIDRAELLRHADVAMSRSKQQRTGVELYESEHDPQTRERLQLVGELHEALLEGQLVLHFQPKGEFATGEILGVEALVRWQHPSRGLLGPDRFIELAERHGLMRRLTLHVLELAADQQQRSQRAGFPLPIAVNISPTNLLDVRFPDDVAELLVRRQLGPGTLQLEITENTVMLDPVRALDTLARLSELGISFALDDFGTGYSSLSQLKRLPVTELKIDRSFVSGMITNLDDATIVRSTVELGRNLGLRVVAEGVETVEQWRELAAIGCHTAQGYYLSRPLPSDQLTRWLIDRARQSPTDTAAHR